jgi:tetratricopeptide (TPR) repeat protein
MGVKFNRFLFSWLIWLFMWPVLAQNSGDSLPNYLILYNSAVKLIDSSRYKESLPILKKAIKEKPDFWGAMNKMAFAKIKLEKYKEAEKDLDKAEGFAPLNYETQKLRGINFFLNGKYAESKAMFDTAAYICIEEKLEDAELFYYRAQLMFKGKGYKNALDACEAATEFNPKYIDAMILKAKIRFAMKDYNHSIKELDVAIKLMSAAKPDYQAYKLRAQSKFEVANYKAAVKDWNIYIEAIPKEEEALVARGAAKINANDNSSAISDLDEAIKLNPKNPVSYCYRGVAKGGNRNYVEALKDLDFAIKLKFDYSTAYVNRAAIKMAVKDKRGACEDLQKADGLGNELALKLYESYCKQK